MVDVNKRALHLTQMNIKNMKVNAECFLSDAYKSVTEKYDIIITNPPIRAGKDKVLEILLGAKEHLNIDGTLYYVIRKDQGAKSITKVLSKTYKIELLEFNEVEQWADILVECSKGTYIRSIANDLISFTQMLKTVNIMLKRKR